MGKLTTHVLDTAHGCPASGVKIELFRAGSERQALNTQTTNSDGRCDSPLLADETFSAGEYEIHFHAGDYFRQRGTVLPDPPFVDRVIIRFGIAEPAENYHVPLLVSPFSYSTYRGS